MAADFSLSRITSAEDRNRQRQVNTQQAAAAGFAQAFPQLVKSEQQQQQQLQHSTRSEASVATICDSMQYQLLLLVEWAKSFPAFIELKVEEQVALLRAHAGEILILGVTYRSRGETSMLILGNSFRVSGNNPDKYMAQVAARVINELVSQFRELEIDFTEYACLKAVVFFDPDAAHLPSAISGQVRQWRHEVLQRMQDYMNSQQYKRRARFGELLLLLPRLQSINHEMIRKVYKTKMEGLAQIDALLQELLLGDTAEVTEATPPITPGSQTMDSGGQVYSASSVEVTQQQQQMQPTYHNGTHEEYVAHFEPQPEFIMSYSAPTTSRTGAQFDPTGGYRGSMDSMAGPVSSIVASSVPVPPIYSVGGVSRDGFRGYSGGMELGSLANSATYKQEL